MDTHRENREQGMLHFSLSLCNLSASGCFQLKKFPELSFLIRQYSVDSSFKNSSSKQIFCIYKHLCQSCTACLLPVFILNLISTSLSNTLISPSKRVSEQLILVSSYTMKEFFSFCSFLLSTVTFQENVSRSSSLSLITAFL